MVVFLENVKAFFVFGLRSVTEDERASYDDNYNINIDNCSVLDICSGTGSLGIESFSRGANAVYFVDKDHKSINLIYIPYFLSLL